MGSATKRSLISAYFLLSAYFLTTQSYKRMCSTKSMVLLIHQIVSNSWLRLCIIFFHTFICLGDGSAQRKRTANHHKCYGSMESSL